MKWVSFIPAVSRRLVVRAAQQDLEPVYISGETGSGKSAIARWIHQNSPRGAKPIVLFSAGDDLAECARRAQDGTLVLQELENFSQAERAELARFIRTRAIVEPAGEGGGVRKMVRARVIATGSAPMSEFSAFEPVFKEFRIHLPSLGDRGAELDDIVDGLLGEMAHELERDHVRAISPEARAALRAHRWRANFRELRNILRYGILKTRGSTIEVAHLPDLNDPYGILLGSREAFRAVELDLQAQSRP